MTTGVSRFSASARRDQIRREAAELFSKFGYHAVGMRTIAEAVGIQTASLYHHFPAKHDILHAISLSVTEHYIEVVLPLLDSDGPRLDRLTCLLREHITYAVTRRPEVLVWRRELPFLSAEPLFMTIVEQQRSYQDRIEKFIAEGVAAGEFFVEDPHVASLALLDMTNGIPSWFRPDGQLATDALADGYVVLGLQMLGTAALAGPKTRPSP